MQMKSLSNSEKFKMSNKTKYSSSYYLLTLELVYKNCAAKLSLLILCFGLKWGTILFSDVYSLNFSRSQHVYMHLRNPVIIGFLENAEFFNSHVKEIRETQVDFSWRT